MNSTIRKAKPDSDPAHSLSRDCFYECDKHKVIILSKQEVVEAQSKLLEGIAQSYFTRMAHVRTALASDKRANNPT